MYDYTLDVEGYATVTGSLELETQTQYYMHKEDREVDNWGYGIRPCASCPAVFPLSDDSHAFFDKQWQFFMRAINYNMSIKHVSALYGTSKAFFNSTGFPGRRNYLTGEGEGKKDPNADKVRTCSRNIVTGIEYGDLLSVKTFDSSNPPPLKTGKSYPQTVDEININDYLYTPQSNIELFVVANRVSPDGRVLPFAHGALYDWTEDGEYYSFFPLISNHGYGDVLYPLAKLVKLPLGSKLPSPYKR